MTDYDDSYSDDDNGDGQSVNKALQQMSNWTGYWTPNIQNARFMRNFLYVDQWTSYERRMRYNKRTITVNNLISIQRALLTEQRESDPQVTFFSIDIQVPQKQINILQDRHRYDSYRSNTKMIYQTSYKDALDTGFGAFYLDVCYDNPNTFQKKITYNACKDVLMCGWDPAANHPNKTDGDYSFIWFTMSDEQFSRQWPDKSAKLAKTAPDIVEGITYQIDSDICYVSKRWYKEYYNKTVYLAENGHSYTKDEYKEYSNNQKQNRKRLKKLQPYLPPKFYMYLYEKTEISPIVDKRTSTDFKIKCCLMSIAEELEVNDFPGKLLPLIFVEGFSSYIEGRQITHPFAEPAVDTQRLMNYLASTMADSLSKSRKEQWLVTPAMTNGLEDLWMDTSNVQGALKYNRDPDNPSDKPIAAQNSPPYNPAYQSLYQQTQQDIRTTTGRYMQNAGENIGFEAQGTVLAKQASGNLTVGVYPDNLMDAIAEGARVWVGLAPEVYDNDMDMVVMDEGGETRKEQVNYKSDMPKYNSMTNEDEYESVNDLTKGQYDVQVYAGQSFAAQNAINMQQMDNMFQASQSPIFSLYADIYMKSMNSPQKNEMVKRAKNFILSPNVVAMDEGKPPPPPPPPTIQQKLEMAKIGVELKEIQADEAKANADRVGAISDAVQKFMELQATKASARAEEIKAISEIESTIIEANSESVEATSRIADALIDSRSKLLESRAKVLDTVLSK